jgi:hypothetical protein
MATDKKKISKNEVDKNPPLFATYGDPRTSTIDPTELRYSNSLGRAAFSFNGLPGGSDGGDDGGEEDPSISKYLPQLSDISIVSEEFDYSTVPATIKLKLKIIDRTDSVIKGIRGRIPQ